MQKKYLEYKELSFPKISQKILKFWEENKIFKKSIENRKDASIFTFYDGPPGANGAPGIHHVISRVIKDIFCRYKTLKGYKVPRKAGWDTHGLPVELKVEKELQITKDDIGKSISIEDYNKECKKTVMAYKKQWDDLTKKMGYWTDLDDPYITFNNDYIESVWYVLKQLYDKELIYKGYKIQPYSPAAGTGLSSHELSIPGCYRNVKDTSVVAQFKIQNADSDYFLAWTTTPWTLPANSALAVGKNIEYVKITTLNQYTFEPINVILAEKVINKFFDSNNKISSDQIGSSIKNFIAKNLKDNKAKNSKNIPWSIISNYKGNDLLNMKYEQLMPYIIPEGDAFRVIPGDFVNTEEGTGIVHISPTFGADDQRVAQKEKISPILVKDESGNDIPIVNPKGQFVKEITDFAGMYVKAEYETSEDAKKGENHSADTLIAIKLKRENKAFKVEKYEHNYPHCWRTDKPILYYPLHSWFIETTKYKDRLIELNKTINWVPEHVGLGRFGNWLENLVDWNLSRERFWGIPLPIWRTKSEGSSSIEQKCIGSIDELRQEVKKSIKAGFMQKELPEDFDLHRPYVDEVILISDTGQKMYREHFVIDVWFDSGAMPYAQVHYPFNSTEKELAFPADFIAEGVDQTRGWFFTLHAIAVMLFDSVAFKNVVVNGLVLDKDGNKMSKRLGNSVEPLKLIEEHGIDVIRWYMVTNCNPWENLKFDISELGKIRRKFFNTLENLYNFFAMYANLDFPVKGLSLNELKFDPNDNIRTEQASNPSRKRFTEENWALTCDNWILSKLNSLIKDITKSYDEYNITYAAREIQKFVTDDLSNWYIRLNRKRYWEDARNEGLADLHKIDAYRTLYECLLTVAKVASPIIPFYTERLYQDLILDSQDNKMSVHLTDFPEYKEDLIDLDLEYKMKNAQTITSLVHSLRKQYKIKVRQPLSRILIPILYEDQRKSIGEIQNLILNETNVKKIEFIEGEQDIIKKKAKPNFKTLGKKYGRFMKELSKVISNLNQEDIRKLESTNNLNLKLLSTDELITINLDDVILSYEEIPGWYVAKENDITVALDTTLSKELQQEGIARELINRLQNLRKDIGLEVHNRVCIVVKCDNNEFTEAIKQFKARICKEVLATSFEVNIGKMDNSNSNESHVLDIDDVNIQVSISQE